MIKKNKLFIILLCFTLLCGIIPEEVPAQTPVDAEKPAGSPLPAVNVNEAKKIMQQRIDDANLYEDVVPIERLVPAEPVLPPGMTLDGPPLDLEECLTLAYRNHPDIRAARHQVEQYEAKLRQALSLYIPDGSVGLTWSDSKLASPIFGNDRLDSTELDLKVGYLIYDSGKRRELIQAARTSLAAADSSYLAAWNQKAYEVSMAYYGLLYSYWLTAIQEDDLNKCRDNLRIAQGFYTTGSKARVDVTQAEIQMRNSQIKLTQARNSLVTSYESLIAAMGVEISDLARRRLEDNIEWLPELPGRDEAVEFMRIHNPQLSYFDNLALASEYMAKSHIADRLPVFTGAASLGLGSTADSHSMPKKGIWSLQFELSVPLFNGAQTKAYADEQRALGAQLLAQKDSAHISLKKQIDVSLTDILAARQRSQQSYQAVETALLNYTLSHSRYRQGVSTIIELNTAIDYLNGARQQYLQSLYDARVGHVMLRQAMGLPELPAAQGSAGAETETGVPETSVSQPDRRASDAGSPDTESASGTVEQMPEEPLRH